MWRMEVAQVSLGAWRIGATNRGSAWRCVAMTRGAWQRRLGRAVDFDPRSGLHGGRWLTEVARGSWWRRVECVRDVQSLLVARAWLEGDFLGMAGKIGGRSVWWRDCRSGWRTVVAHGWMGQIFGRRVEAHDMNDDSDIGGDGTICFRSIDWHCQQGDWPTLEGWSLEGRSFKDSNSWRRM
jgi:hypothetical protein